LGALSIGTGQDDGVPVGVVDPELAVGRSAGFAFRRIAVRWEDDIQTHRCGAGDRCVEVVDLEPQQHPVTVRAVVWLADTTVIVLDVEAVQLHHQLTAIDQALIVRAAVVAAHAQQFLIPPAAHLDVGGTDQWLGTHIPETTPS
jgi:hypothetical protein